MQVLGVAILAWFIAQMTKVIRRSVKKGKIDLYSLVASGGMPSSHTALVVALTTQIGIIEGVNSSLFAISSVLSFITMYDAAGVRRAVGLQARKINQLLDGHIEDDDDIDEEKLKEILGHTPLEVAGGIILGVLVALFFYYFINFLRA